MMQMVYKPDYNGPEERPDITEIDGLPELVEDVESALEEAEKAGEDIKWMKVRPPIIAVDFAPGTPVDEVVEFFDDYLADVVPEDEYNAKLIDFTIFGIAIEICPRDYAYVEEELPSLADEIGGEE